jgi:hypothetical protein
MLGVSQSFLEALERVWVWMGASRASIRGFHKQFLVIRSRWQAGLSVDAAVLGVPAQDG